ncbi:MAG: hypothetical protein LUH21_17650 [Clostridiales bacterium]|nr:hypothetical protein [Clostridiales bacterium]
MAYKNILLNNLGATPKQIDDQLRTTLPPNSVSLLSLNPDTEPVIEIDSDSRVISIPTEIKSIGIVAGDHLAETFYFHISRYFDNNDLSEHRIIIRYINAGNEYGESDTVDLKIEENDLIFGWEIDNKATRHAGDIYFTVQFETVNNGIKYQWQSLPATLTVKAGLDIESTITDKDDLLFRTLNKQIQDLQDKYDALINSDLIKNLDIFRNKLDSLEQSIRYLEENVVYVSKD